MNFKSTNSKFLSETFIQSDLQYSDSLTAQKSYRALIINHQYLND